MRLIKTAVIVAVAYAGVRWFERSNLYFPSRDFSTHPGSYGVKYEDVSFQAEDKTKLQGWWLPARYKTAESTTILFFNGNAGNISHRLEKAMILHRLGFNLFLFDYRGYGRSSGRPSEQGNISGQSGGP